MINFYKKYKPSWYTFLISTIITQSSALKLVNVFYRFPSVPLPSGPFFNISICRFQLFFKKNSLVVLYIDTEISYKMDFIKWSIFKFVVWNFAWMGFKILWCDFWNFVGAYADRNWGKLKKFWVFSAKKFLKFLPNSSKTSQIFEHFLFQWKNTAWNIE